MPRYPILKTFIVLLLLIIAVGLFWLFPQRSSKNTGPIENIKGIPFPQTHDATLITEQLAHTDIYLNEPVLARQLKLKATLTPLATSSISVGLRANPFWLSYTQQPLYTASSDQSVNQPIQAEVTIPLTDKLLDQDSSLDMMFFSNSPNLSTIDQPYPDETYWLLHDLQINIEPTVPSRPEIKDFIYSILKREKPL
jgi:hypothetical protein